MAGNFDGIIRRAMGIDDPQPDEPMLTYPPSTARVPPDTMRDTPFYSSVRPDVGSETTTKIPSNQELEQQGKLARMQELSNQMQAVSRGAHNPAQFDQLMQEFDQLNAQHRAYFNAVRNQRAAEERAIPGDVDTMVQAIQRRQQLGRNE